MHDTCAQCGNPTEGCKAMLMLTPLCYRCSDAMEVVQKVLDDHRRRRIPLPVSSSSSFDKAVFLMSVEDAEKYEAEAVKRAREWGEKNLPKGEPPPPPSQLTWAKEVWG